MTKRRPARTTRQETLADEIERDLTNDDAWERLPDAASPGGPLSTQVSVRLDAEDAKRLRRVARAQQVGYTSLLREWIKQRLDLEQQLLTSFSYETRGYAATSSPIQVSSQMLHIRALVSV